MPPGTEWFLIDRDGRECRRGRLEPRGALWGASWWVADFSGCRTPGEYAVELRPPGAAPRRGEPFAVGDDILWRGTWRAVGLDQLERRRALAPGGLGWQDCGSMVHKPASTLREAMSHAAMVIGLTDALEFRSDGLDADERRAVAGAALHGCAYLAACQDLGAELGLGDGALAHEIDRFRYAIPGEMPKCAVAFARAARLACGADGARRRDLLDRAARALDWHRARRIVVRTEVHPRALGAPEDFAPPEDPMTCDLLMEAWGAWELAKAGAAGEAEHAARAVERVLSRQVAPDAPDHGFHGHFRTFDAGPVTEKAWSHHGFGFNCGAVFPHYLLPVIEMCRADPGVPGRARWREALRRFAYGYFLPACDASPFHLLPNGVFPDEGLLHFSGLGHGMNAAYAWAAALALEFERFFEDAAFRRIATGNLQWIAGLNAGLTREALAGAWHFRAEVPEGVALPCSMIRGIGRRWGGGWLDIPGSICNGFDADKQFKFDLPPRRETDGPNLFTDEDWITHAGAWLSALSRLRRAGG
jgi:hypothetical protein